MLCTVFSMNFTKDPTCFIMTLLPCTIAIGGTKMTDEKDLHKIAAADPEEPSSPKDAAKAPAPSVPYVRERPAHRSVAPIDGLSQEDEDHEQVAHDSGFTTGGGALSGRAYRRSRAEGQQLRRDLHYGQYLEIPKGRRDIFASREHKTRAKTIVALVAVIAVLAVVIFFVWEYMQMNWGAVS